MTKHRAMDRKRPNLVGLRFGRLRVEELGPALPMGTRGKKLRYWRCACDCGNATLASTAGLRSGGKKSCGCALKEWLSDRNKTRKHGLVGSRTYQSWSNMIQRCTNPDNSAYANYGARGIAVSDRWLDFANFLADMGERSAEQTLDRIDNDRGYEPGNCRWASRREQTNNRRNTRSLTVDGKTLPLSEWADFLGCNHVTLSARLRAGWSAERTIKTPINKSKGQYDRSNMKKRRKLSYSARLASVLVTLKRANGEPLIPEDVRAKGTKAIIAHVQWDHIIPIALDGSNDFHNIQPLTKDDHLAKTKQDIKTIAKGKRITKKQAEFRRRLLARDSGERTAPSKWPSRPLRSRNTFQDRP